MNEKLYLPVRVVIADDHEVFRDGLKTLLEKNELIQIVGEASNGHELIEICREVKPDIALTDIKMPIMDGIEASAYIYSHFPSIKIIALSMFNQDNLILDMINAGASGYLIKNASKKEIIEAINSVNKDIPYYCRSTSIKLAKLIGANGLGNKSFEKISFSEKEIEIIKLICEEKTSKEIADIIFVSPRTVDEYRERIREKMKVKGTAGIVIYALQNDLIKIERK
jgi:two-component system, NarL family, response regulator NreC